MIDVALRGLRRIFLIPMMGSHSHRPPSEHFDVREAIVVPLAEPANIFYLQYLYLLRLFKNKR